MALTLAGLYPILAFKPWSICAAALFGLPEAFGVWRRGDRLPPLTFAIRRYVPRWLTFTLINGLVFGAAAYWLGMPHAERFVGLGALQGWLSNHFTVTYDD